MLERGGYQVITASSGQQALEVFNQTAVDGVVLDFAMPGMNGQQVAHAMRLRRPQVPILLLSAYVGLPQELVSMVDLLATKGDGPEDLLAKVQLLLQAGGRE